MPDHHAALPLDSPDATCAFAQALAPRVQPGDTLLLSGGVGAGKTHFARCLIQALQTTPEDVPSPTFTLVQTYPGKTGEIWHADLYRVGDVLELVELGLTDAFTDAICLVEWPDRLGDLTPADALSLTFETVDASTDRAAEDRRLLHADWQNEKWTQRLKGLFHD
ncbi:tRNA (adenosine(37)-N6)-threonylcarbamoyltransferase complex ATPase subunit type 1 TsaE [uncultured Roseovarius sp.]|uniref:tRNA (adenosine(37)-N6)-threonylcarbamoyltransferase complex ATPase subunit type 1 TsaE n=1 Tax=uncultured Roseovarius sp. TaxID=293344 RepID=UPI002616D6BE|nr:tRNA (adenosine(37)-N6)-threonylcarbamoyltransferase complex ATPase subunit type 1 TsaE [uncultured Roseovarius sp.]